MLQVVKHYILFFCVLFQTAILFTISTTAQIKTSAPTNWPEPVFEHLTIADGLPENSVHCMLQDHLGYLWLGTQNGLVKYDGYNMKIYQPDFNDSLSISNRQIMTIYEDKSGILWIGTRGGLNALNRTTETFTRYIYNPNDSRSINSNLVISICEDKMGDLLVGTDDGLFLINRQNKHISKFYSEDTSVVRAITEDRLTGNVLVAVNNHIMIFYPETKVFKKKDVTEANLKLGIINSFYQATDGTVWIGHSKGLARFNSLDNNIMYYQPIQSNYSNADNNINNLSENEDGLIWGTSGIHPESEDLETAIGIICFDSRNEEFYTYKYDDENKAGHSGTRIWSLYIDHSGILWVGTWGSGLNKWDRLKHQFKRFNYDSNGERFKLVYNLFEDHQGIIWLGTNNGLYSYNLLSNEFRNYKYNIKNNEVTHIYKDEKGMVWFGTFTKGLGRFDVATGSFLFHSNDPNDSTTISNNYVRIISPADRNILWIGTWGGGLNKFDKRTGKFTRYKHDPGNSQSLSQDEVLYQYKDQQGTLWIATDEGGLNRFNSFNESFNSFMLDRTSASSTTTIYEDYKGNFWVGTSLGGVYLFDRVRETPIYSITEKDGLPFNRPTSVLEDDSGNLWISTDLGLSRFNLETHKIKSYSVSNVFEENKFYLNSACKTSTGDMLFGTYDGFIMFNPNSIKDDPFPPQVVISNVSLFNEPDKKLKIGGFISELKELNLLYNENDLRFDYVGLQFADPSKNRYKYKLEGFDKDWIDAGTQRNATYTNLDAGEYIFRVTACNADGVWNEEGVSLKIIIPPPFWATWWAYGFYLIIFGSVLYGIRKYEMNRLNWKNQSKLDVVKLKEREETDKMKSRFFANISHEFRTPLTLILGPSESIVQDSNQDEIKKKAGTIKRNANRLLGLINQLLDLSKLEAGKLELKASKSNIVPFIKGITMSFESVAERKDITLKVKLEKKQIELYFDKEKMTKIMTNLLSNAFKFTPEGGAISVSVNECHSELGSGSLFNKKMLKQVQHDNCVEIKVKDTGIGISEEELPKLFDRFYQVDSSQTREHEGTGIGLALTKELVELQRGTISVTSEEGVGSEFSIILPVGREHLKDDQIIDENVILTPLEQGKNLTEAIVDEAPIVDSLPHYDKLSLTEKDNEGSEDKNIILIVEDNADVREFIKDSLGNAFQIEEASNGEQGVRKAEQIIPDLIISDVMMPKMDGNELTRILKNNEKTSHIPIILLTAKSEQQSKLKGLETGADDYITKPFITKELQIRIKNLINIRIKLQEKYRRADFIPTNKETEKKLTNLEEQFMSKVMEVIEQYISEEEFTIEDFGKEVGMSRMQLHRKLKALTGKSASNYLRSVRLSKAKKMIEEEKGTISEIAYSVGFSSPQYFTRSFKEEFGYPPSDLIN